MMCDLCGEVRKCRARQIEGKVYDFCSDCWRALADKLKGKGRPVREEPLVLLPPTLPESERKELKPSPGQRPKIWAGRIKM